MTRERAVLFDLDDTLYAERRFALSGFREVARLVESVGGAPAPAAFAVLRRAMTNGSRATAFQSLCQTFGYPLESVPVMVDVYRRHVPSLRLPSSACSVLSALQPAWKIGVVTNGLADVQRRKMMALGLYRVVDAVVCASEHGSGRGKPDREPFLEAATRLGVRPDRCVFVGDDAFCDVLGASRVGMRTIQYARGGAPSEPPALAADAFITNLEDVVRLAPRLVAEARPRCA